MPAAESDGKIIIMKVINCIFMLSIFLLRVIVRLIILTRTIDEPTAGGTEEKVTNKKAAQRNETHTRDFQVDENRWSENRGKKRDEKSQLDFASCHSSRSCVSLRCEEISYPRSRHVSEAAGVLQQGGISASNWERSLRQKVWDFDTTRLFARLNWYLFVWTGNSEWLCKTQNKFPMFS